MPRKKEPTLQEVTASLLTLEEASQWIESHQAEFGLAKIPNTETLKKAAQFGRLKATLKGRLYLTREQELRDYLQHFDPKNKTESRPLKPRAIKRREAKVAARANPPQNEEATETAQELSED
jgi:hypothetical protein